MFGKKRIAELENEIQNWQAQIAKAEKRAKGLINYGKACQQKLDSYFAYPLQSNANDVLTAINKMSVDFHAGWDPQTWQRWQPAIWSLDNITDGIDTTLPTLIRIGDLVEQRHDIKKLKFKVPAFVPFIGEHKTIIIQSRGEQGAKLFQSLLIRTALMLPHQTYYTLLDPATNGLAFPMRRYLPSVRENSGDVRRDLEQVLQDIQRIVQNFIDATYPSFEQVDPKVRINERFQFVFAADFPNKYDRRAIEILQHMASTGSKAGVYTFIHYNADHKLPRDISMEGFENAVYINLNDSSTMTACALQLYPDANPQADLQNALFEKLREAKPPERIVEWDGEVGLPKEKWWKSDATHIVQTPIGISGASDALNLWFGVNNEGMPCAHGMMGAMTGSGKSNLYHVLILGLAVRYSPNELQLYLIDGKDGVEFQPYRDLPHAKVVSLRSSAQLSRSVLAELIAEKERRNQIFATLKVRDLTGYREKGQGNMPRILLLIDEYHELFSGDTDGMASNQLLQLAQQGRSVGIHMLLGSQRFGAPGMLHQTAIFGNIHLRIAMQMSTSDIQALTEFGRRGKQLILSCDLPGKIVINDRQGDDNSNKLGKIALLKEAKRDTLIKQLINKANHAANEIPTTIVFDGQEQPNLTENPYISYLMHQPKWLEKKAWEELARKPIHAEGLNVVDWFTAEHPYVMWLGQEFSVRGQAMIIIRRRVAEHILIIGGANAVRYGMIASAIASLCLNTDNAKFIIMDRSIPDTPWNETLQHIKHNVLNGYPVSFYTENAEIETVLDELTAELVRRKQLPEKERKNEPSIFAIMTELERIDEIRRQTDAYGMSDSPLSQKLQTICVEGASMGIHLILSFSGVRPMSYVIDERRGLNNFRHRVALQMSEEESLTLVRGRKAAMLQQEGPTPICALYMDIENDKSTRFKPYSIESKSHMSEEQVIDFHEQIVEIGQRLATWSKAL
jgi:S-DNA-T family DNA segregation ATPase FtsK/SpoIIIE